MRLLFVARAMNNMAGGVERMITAIANAMVARGHDVSLFSWDEADADAFYPIDPAIQWFRLDMGNPAKRAGARLSLKRMPKVRAIVRDFAPDLIVCFQGGPFQAMQLFTLGMGIPLIAAERTSPTLYDHAGSARKRFIEHQAFRFAKRITIQFERYRELYPSYLRAKMVTIPNPVAPASALARPEVPAPGGRNRLLAVGRLSYQKNFPVLIEALDQLAPRFPDWDLRIVGEGEDRPLIEQQLSSMTHLKGRVALPGATPSIKAEYLAANLFCLPARWEGFPNALAEALAHGLPSVGFAGCAGVSDLIANGQNGMLATGNNNAAALAEVLAPLMSSPKARAQMGAVAVQSVAPYRPEVTFDLWEDTFRKCLDR